MKRIYVDVDTQFDFCDPHGALFVQGAPEAARVSAKLVSHAMATGARIVGSVDSHHHASWEFNTNETRGPNGEKPGFPPHCVKGTSGWLKLPETLAKRFVFVPVDAVTATVPAETQAVYFEKEVYSMFANPNAATMLSAWITDEPVEFVVFGVATDYCVRAAALGLVAWTQAQANEKVRASRVTVVRDAVAGVAPASTEQAMQEMSHAGIQFVASAQLLGS